MATPLAGIFSFLKPLGSKYSSKLAAALTSLLPFFKVKTLTPAALLVVFIGISEDLTTIAFLSEEIRSRSIGSV